MVYIIVIKCGNCDCCSGYFLSATATVNYGIVFSVCGAGRLGFVFFDRIFKCVIAKVAGSCSTHPTGSKVDAGSGSIVVRVFLYGITAKSTAPNHTAFGIIGHNVLECGAGYGNGVCGAAAVGAGCSLGAVYATAFRANIVRVFIEHVLKVRNNGMIRAELRATFQTVYDHVISALSKTRGSCAIFFDRC